MRRRTSSIPERQDARRTGAGGVPVRSADDYRALYEASRRGNYPLLRTYSGTDDFLELAEMYVEYDQHCLVCHSALLVQRRGRTRSLGSGRLHPRAPEGDGLLRRARHPGRTQ